MNLRAHLDEIRTAALSAVDPAATVRRFLRRRGEILEVGAASWSLSDFRQIRLVGFGKAVMPMAEAVLDVLGSHITEGLVITKYGHAEGYLLPETIDVIEAGHPVPDTAGQNGAERVVSFLEGAKPRDLVVVLISGGGSALLPLPVEGVSLKDLRVLTGHLLRSGATIDELNAVRKHLSRLKGGQLARLASPATVVTLILSDVVGDPLDVIASGPTVPDLSTFGDAWEVLERYEILSRIPKAVRTYLQQGRAGQRPETPKPGASYFDRVHNYVVASNRQAAHAAVKRARSLGYRALLLTTFVEGEAREIAKMAAALVKGIRAYGDPLSPPACLVWGGETTVTVTGPGKGGRNQELALAAALELEGITGFGLMALATDGTDGPTDAGGAAIDGSTVTRARSLGLNPDKALVQNDAYPLLAAVDDLLLIDPTGTNVNDLLVILVVEGGRESPVM